MEARRARRRHPTVSGPCIRWPSASGPAAAESWSTIALARSCNQCPQSPGNCQGGARWQGLARPRTCWRTGHRLPEIGQASIPSSIRLWSWAPEQCLSGPLDMGAVRAVSKSLSRRRVRRMHAPLRQQSEARVPAKSSAARVSGCSMLIVHSPTAGIFSSGRRRARKDASACRKGIRQDSRVSPCPWTV